MNAINIQNLFFSYADTPTLKDVTFQVKVGEFIGLVGPNGGGKTTLLMLLMGFLKPSQGELEIFGKSPLKARSTIGYVPQAFRYDMSFPISTLEVVLTGRLSKLTWWGAYRKEDQTEALEALDKVGMKSFAKKPFSSLSGGQAQRVLIARALVSKPQILLLDEPTASVDGRSSQEIYAILRALKGSLTILMVTHDLKTTIDQVDRIICIQGDAAVLSKNEVCQHVALGLYHGASS